MRNTAARSTVLKVRLTEATGIGGGNTRVTFAPLRHPRISSTRTPVWRNRVLTAKASRGTLQISRYVRVRCHKSDAAA